MSEKLYRAAKYIRLSHTDDKSVESDSVSNQRRILDSYIGSQPDIEAVSEWVDDGVSGIIFDRPAFKEMMTSIETGEINCVIVKDVSRLGREFVETGRYLRKVFPAYGVRFIALNDNIDTLNDQTDDLMLSVRTIVNDAYCRDISIKTRSALNAKRENGDYVSCFTIYGYLKSPDNRNQLIVDEYPASIVRDIFRMKLEGISALRIADILNGEGVLSPLEHKKARGIPHAKNGFCHSVEANWSATAVFRILKDETYTGTLIQGCKGTPNYKIKRRINRTEQEWHRTENAHEAIISKLDFDLAQRIMRLDTRTAPHSDKVYLFSGILICGCCGARMSRKTVPYKGEKYHYYYCPTTKKRGCLNAPMVKESELDDCVFNSVMAHIKNVVTLDAKLESENGKRRIEALAAQCTACIADIEKKLQTVRKCKSSLYEDMVTGIISKDDFKTLRQKFASDEAEQTAKLEAKQQELSDVLEGKSERLRWAEHFKQFEGLTALDRRMVISLISSIKVVSKTELEITFNYQDEFESAVALTERSAA